jgi:HPt (histidine-containing phosphotransfer) domain-containing protein
MGANMTSGDFNFPESQAPVFNPTRLDLLLEMEEDGDTSTIKEIAAQFLEDITIQIDSVDSAIRGQDFPKVASAAHTIKGSAATFGLDRVEKLARQLEESAKGANHGGESAIHLALCEAFASGGLALNAYLEAK